MEESEEKKTSGYGKRPMWQWLLVYAVIAVILYGGFYYFFLAKKGGYSSTQTGQYQAPAQQTATPTTSMAMQEITVTGSEFAFTPSTITVKKGQSVKITFKNTGAYPHNFTLADLNVQTKTIQPGEQDTITFTPVKTGSFAYICTVPGHADKGMKGTLIVQ